MLGLVDHARRHCEREREWRDEQSAAAAIGWKGSIALHSSLTLVPAAVFLRSSSIEQIGIRALAAALSAASTRSASLLSTLSNVVPAHRRRLGPQVRRQHSQNERTAARASLQRS